MLPLPHSPGCIVCGRDNPHGLQLTLSVDPQSGEVVTEYTSRPHHIGFIGVIHGGVIATIVDEAMVWAATWAGKRFCVCGELNVRYRQIAPVNAAMKISAKIEAVRSRLIETTATVKGNDGTLYATASGKYVPIAKEQNQQFVATLIDDPTVGDTLHALRKGMP
ncbi:MAG TPA: PaaI family thioesterase [Humisphaera sp.]|jgi:acyl-coenzyme A thioesterase PaaI-like protein|nr:PaaI family thioesterase [Humisphaera sp.]